jgi:GDP-L-fucose synthase
MEWREQRVLLTGGSGFLGSVLRERLAAEGPEHLLAPGSRELDLRAPHAVRAYLERHRPTLIVHAAATVGGIGANRRHPGRFFYENAVMGIHLIEEARRLGVQKLVCLGTVCAYPRLTPVPFREENLWDGYPESTNAPYGIAKKALLVQLQAYRQEYGFNGIFLLLVNLYGPGDNFDLEAGHVIPAMIRKFVEAHERGAPEVTLWGDGSPTREFLFVADAAEGIVQAAARYDDPEPMNLGSGREISIADLAEAIRTLVGYDGRIVWDTTKPNGQPRRRLDVGAAERALGFRASTAFDAGLRATVDWYLAHRRA